MKHLFILIFLVVAAGCAQVKVRTSYDTKISFSEYKTWCWLKGCELVYEGPGYLNDSATIENIGNAIAVQMQEKGFTQVDDNADLIVDFHIVVTSDSAIFSRVYEEDLPFWEPYEEEYYQFLRGTLIIDVADRKKSRMIWRSTAERLMALNPDLKKSDIDVGIKKALKDFPPKPKE